MMKNASLPKISILLQFEGEILALLCPDDSIQILLKFCLSSYINFGTETKLEGFVWSQQGISGIDIISIIQEIQTVSFVNYIFGVLSFSSAST